MTVSVIFVLCLVTLAILYILYIKNGGIMGIFKGIHGFLLRWQLSTGRISWEEYVTWIAFNEFEIYNHGSLVFEEYAEARNGRMAIRYTGKYWADKSDEDNIIDHGIILFDPNYLRVTLMCNCEEFPYGALDLQSLAEKNWEVDLTTDCSQGESTNEKAFYFNYIRRFEFTYA